MLPRIINPFSTLMDFSSLTILCNLHTDITIVLPQGRDLNAVGLSRLLVRKYDTQKEVGTLGKHQLKLAKELAAVTVFVSCSSCTE